MKYYIMPKNEVGQRVVLKQLPVNLDGVDIIILPDNNGYLRVISRNKEYPDYKVALAIITNQINITDVTAGENPK